jgi:hypothetical protein
MLAKYTVIKIIMANQKSVSSKDKKLASKIIMKGVTFLSNLIPFIEKVGIFEIIKIEGISK